MKRQTPFVTPLNCFVQALSINDYTLLLFSLMSNLAVVFWNMGYIHAPRLYILSTILRASLDLETTLLKNLLDPVLVSGTLLVSIDHHHATPSV